MTCSTLIGRFAFDPRGGAASSSSARMVVRNSAYARVSVLGRRIRPYEQRSSASFSARTVGVFATSSAICFLKSSSNGKLVPEKSSALKRGTRSLMRKARQATKYEAPLQTALPRLSTARRSPSRIEDRAPDSFRRSHKHPLNDLARYSYIVSSSSLFTGAASSANLVGMSENGPSSWSAEDPCCGW